MNAYVQEPSQRCCRLAPPVHVEFLKDIVEVVFDRGDTDVELPGDLFIGVPLIEKARDREFSICKSLSCTSSRGRP